MFHVERWQSGCHKMFHVEQKCYMLKRFKLNFLHYLTKIIWWFRGKVVSLQRDLEI
jgi:hypothetical protein